mmetsp:Transcript_25331/g.45846  ORF Transcript_25331/g.45846 Transcript_25331/m.45846 type:complete len:947 (+) Transcript_25331:63-2903(+)|eukprot:CAMPEP_0197628740 /NCGR_PEP_ID=MMETSP1338-20131121/6909_1 /TAXON_ID=43686 ORGANISM="Pelagodinium beii, Strain RCC1491" /NCGR_SAMPLE_ID=MMETSP1338 /ASSEMBLY_ACC=CAM_ASM_000754 /LENGTH=946 /DNA_ID=CAMNT_0043199733 /DNA_START=62 /DNA_END=2902 /DNA_ORIENTATION=-
MATQAPPTPAMDAPNVPEQLRRLSIRNPIIFSATAWTMACVGYAAYEVPEAPLTTPELLQEQLQRRIKSIPVPPKNPRFQQYTQYYLHQHDQQLQEYKMQLAQWQRSNSQFNWRVMLQGLGAGVMLLAAVLAFLEYNYGAISYWMEATEELWNDTREKWREWQAKRRKLADSQKMERLLEEMGEGQDVASKKKERKKLLLTSTENTMTSAPAPIPSPAEGNVRKVKVLPKEEVCSQAVPEIPETPPLKEMSSSETLQETVGSDSTECQEVPISQMPTRGSNQALSGEASCNVRERLRKKLGERQRLQVEQAPSAETVIPAGGASNTSVVRVSKEEQEVPLPKPPQLSEPQKEVESKKPSTATPKASKASKSQKPAALSAVKEEPSKRPDSVKAPVSCGLRGAELLREAEELLSQLEAENLLRELETEQERSKRAADRKKAKKTKAAAKAKATSAKPVEPVSVSVAEKELPKAENRNDDEESDEDDEDEETSVPKQEAVEPVSPELLSEDDSTDCRSSSAEEEESAAKGNRKPASSDEESSTSAISTMIPPSPAATTQSADSLTESKRSSWADMQDPEEDMVKEAAKTTSVKPSFASIQKLHSRNAPLKAPQKPTVAAPAAPPAAPAVPPTAPPKLPPRIAAEKAAPKEASQEASATTRPCNYAEAAGAKNIDLEVSKLLTDLGIGSTFDELLDFLTTNSSEKWRKDNLPGGDYSDLSFTQIRRLVWKLLQNIQEQDIENSAGTWTATEGALAGAQLLGMLRGNVLPDAAEDVIYPGSTPSVMGAKKYEKKDGKWQPKSSQKDDKNGRRQELESENPDVAADSGKLRAEAPEFVPVAGDDSTMPRSEPHMSNVIGMPSLPNGWQLVMVPLPMAAAMQGDAQAQIIPQAPMMPQTMPQMQEGMQLMTMPFQQAQAMMPQQPLLPACDALERQVQDMEQDEQQELAVHS